MTKKKAFETETCYLLVDHEEEVSNGRPEVEMYSTLEEVETRLKEIIEEENITDDDYLVENFEIYKATQKINIKVNKRFVLEE